MRYPAQIVGFSTASPVYPCRLVCADPERVGGVVQAAGDGRPFVGVSDLRGASGAAVVDVCLSGIEIVEYGDVVAVDDPLTSDAQGRAVPVNASAARAAVVGFAMQAGDVGDKGAVRLAPFILTQ